MKSSKFSHPIAIYTHYRLFIPDQTLESYLPISRFFDNLDEAKMCAVQSSGYQNVQIFCLKFSLSQAPNGRLQRHLIALFAPEPGGSFVELPTEIVTPNMLETTSNM